MSQLDKSKNYIIANVPYKFVDLFYSTPQELYAIIEQIEKRVYKTNNDVFNYYLLRGRYKNIVLVVDEAHLYFNARKWNKDGLMERLDILLTQCRKRNIKIYFISQRLKRVDINIRRMTDFVVRYQRSGIPILGIQRSRRTVYANEGDLADIQGDDSKTYVMNSDSKGPKTDIEKSKMESSLFLPLLKIFWFPFGKWLSQGQFANFQGEAHNSYFISGLSVKSTRSTFAFRELLIEEKPLTAKEKKIKNQIHKNLPTLVKLLNPNTKKMDPSIDHQLQIIREATIALQQSMSIPQTTTLLIDGLEETYQTSQTMLMLPKGLQIEGSGENLMISYQTGLEYHPIPELTTGQKVALKELNYQSLHSFFTVSAMVFLGALFFDLFFKKTLR